MKNKLLWILLAFTLAALNTTQAAPQLMPLQQQSQAAHLSAEVLTKYHYKHLPLDDILSSKIFDNYLAVGPLEGGYRINGVEQRVVRHRKVRLERGRGHQAL